MKYLMLFVVVLFFTPMIVTTRVEYKADDYIRLKSERLDSIPDTTDFVIERIEQYPYIHAQFAQYGDSCTTQVFVYGTNLDVSANVWELVDNFTMTGAQADTVWQDTFMFYNLIFRAVAGDTVRFTGGMQIY